MPSRCCVITASFSVVIVFLIRHLVEPRLSVPLASAIAQDMRASCQRPSEIISVINRTISGIEIDPALARLSELLYGTSCVLNSNRRGRSSRFPIKQRDTLTHPTRPIFDAVIVNPPYGRVFRPDKSTLKQFSDVISSGYVNLYSLFIMQAIRWLKPDGVACFIIPMSFLGGPYFSSLRRFLLQNTHVVSLDPIEQRSDLFLDVLCDVCVLTVRKHGIKKVSAKATSTLLRFEEVSKALGMLDVPATPSDRIWALPDSSESAHFTSVPLRKPSKPTAIRSRRDILCGIARRSDTVPATFL